MVLETIFHWIIQYKYMALFTLLMFGIIGLPVPDEILMTFVGYLIHKGNLSAAPAVAAALCGSISGITVSYFLGKAGALILIKKHGWILRVTPEKLARAQDWFNRGGKWTLVIGYYLPGIRHLIAVVAGASSLNYRVFAIFAYTGAALWVSVFISAGYFLGDAWYYVAQQIHHDLLIISLAAILIGLAYFLWRKRKKKE